MQPKRLMIETACPHGEFEGHYFTASQIEEAYNQGIIIDEMGDPRCDKATRHGLSRDTLQDVLEDVMHNKLVEMGIHERGRCQVLARVALDVVMDRASDTGKSI